MVLAKKMPYWWVGKNRHPDTPAQGLQFAFEKQFVFVAERIYRIE